MNFDYSGLINLALVTIVYSSFIGPNLKKLGSLKDEIIDTKFPIIDLKDSEDDKKILDTEIQEKGVAIDKKLTQYDGKYNEIKIFLIFFYSILVVIFSFQVGLMIYSQNGSAVQIVSLASAASIIILLAISINVYIVRPWKLRTFSWLAHNGIASTYTEQLVKSTFVLNGGFANSSEVEDSANFTIRQMAKFVGYKYILLVEGADYEKLYYCAAGDVGKYTNLSPLTYPNGDNGYEFSLGKVKLKVGHYVAKLILFNAPYGGDVAASGAILKFEVQKEGIEADVAPIEFNDDKELKDPNIKFNGSRPGKKYKIRSITFKESFTGDKNTAPILSSKRFIDTINRIPRPFTLTSHNGSLDRHYIERYITRRRIIRARIARLLRRPSKKGMRYNLLKDI